MICMPCMFQKKATVACIYNSIDNLKKRRCGMIANETTIHQRSNKVCVSNYMQPFLFELNKTSSVF